MPRLEGITTLSVSRGFTAPIDDCRNAPIRGDYDPSRFPVSDCCFFDCRNAPIRGDYDEVAVFISGHDSLIAEMPRLEGITTFHCYCLHFPCPPSIAEMPRLEGITTSRPEKSASRGYCDCRNAPIRGDYDSRLCSTTEHPCPRLQKCPD